MEVAEVGSIAATVVGIPIAPSGVVGAGFGDCHREACLQRSGSRDVPSAEKLVEDEVVTNRGKDRNLIGVERREAMSGVVVGVAVVQVFESRSEIDAASIETAAAIGSAIAVGGLIARG